MLTRCIIRMPLWVKQPLYIIVKMEGWGGGGWKSVWSVVQFAAWRLFWSRPPSFRWHLVSLIPSSLSLSLYLFLADLSSCFDCADCLQTLVRFVCLSDYLFIALLPGCRRANETRTTFDGNGFGRLNSGGGGGRWSISAFWWPSFGNCNEDKLCNDRLQTRICRRRINWNWVTDEGS